MKTRERYHHAVQKRDARYDGLFFYGVKTTGIYCRPSCPARPCARNLVFFSSRQVAESNGYRACRRCKPDADPRHAAWAGTSAVVRRALRRLARPDALEISPEEFAELFGVSARHLRRLFAIEVGLTPRQIALEHRLSRASALLVGTQIPITEIALTSGFGSIRRFNDAFREKFKQSPSAFRGSKGDSK